jgi:HlyD family secretion protein
MDRLSRIVRALFFRFDRFALAPWLALLALGGACSGPTEEVFHGYAEGEFIFVAPLVSGTLERLEVARGMQVQAGAPLFSLEAVNEQAGVRGAEEQHRAAVSRLEDLIKGQRPSELEAIGSRLRDARAALDLARVELARQERLFAQGVIARDDLDRARTTFEQATARANDLAAQLRTARLGGRADAVQAARNDAEAARAALDRAVWLLDQRRRVAPEAGLVFDTYFNPGEIVAVGAPVASLLPPRLVRVRFFVPEAVASEFAPGQEVRIACDGCAAGLTARINYVSPQAEYTPPVIYSADSRAKLVFMIEARPDEATAARLHPGQPVDVRRVR